MRDQLEQLNQEALAEIATTDSVEGLENVRVAILGRKGKLTGLLRGLGQVPPNERPLMGELANRVKESVTEAITARQQNLKEQALRASLLAETVDITLPGRKRSQGGIHPVTRAMGEITTILMGMGFEPASGPEVESDWFNFEALNIPADHPAREMHDTFYLPDFPGGGRRLLRTHTSPVQIRTMTNRKPPLRVIAGGKVFRCDSDLTHTPMFHQMEGFMVDRDVHFGHLKGLLETFLIRFFERSLPVRFRPSFFPFTEPSAEVDMGCLFCEGTGCRVCKGSGWLEVAGCGMIHPAVLHNVGIDREIYSGFAFGMGVDRFAMLKYGIDDLRNMFDNDVRFLTSQAVAGV
ncbi:MAG: phenylalanine--tRNA ligase subunit alpha [Magnetococcales bacterium]|nr:phenylalanine--tRNA ligase subunit alpha [Magnetococcales bacterium]NGZ27130.1 phenylalanine--tRNA ligase subunit alpha [Magnetococcales bacterium]